jgi:hypothetical protein
MAVRVTATEVRDIMDGCELSDSIVESFISAGTLVVDRVFTGDTTISDALLKEIERWLVAHMIASTVHRTTSEEKIGDASVKYTGQWGKKLESTPYGQQVLLLDSSGMMANAGKAAAYIYAVKSFDE